jgi:hypothetical protein
MAGRVHGTLLSSDALPSALKRHVARIQFPHPRRQPHEHGANDSKIGLQADIKLSGAKPK